MKHLKKLMALTLMLGVVMTATACGSKAPDQAKPTGEQPAEKPAATEKYLIATDTTFAPFEFEDKDGNFIGIDMDILKAISEDQGFEYEVQILGFNAAVQALESKQVDGVIAGMSITDERKAKFDFSEPYFDSGVVMGVKADDATTKGYSDLKGKKVAVKTGTEGATFAESIKAEYGFETVYFEDSSSVYEDVKAGNSIACFEDYPTLGYAITQNVGLKTVTEKEQGSSYGFAVGKGLTPELLEKFNKGLANIKESGKYQEILDKYI
ncbi:MAG: transporter substrate-binding domain-containing protein [Oscillospiraceae bacterium]